MEVLEVPQLHIEVGQIYAGREIRPVQPTDMIRATWHKSNLVEFYVRGNDEQPSLRVVLRHVENRNDSTEFAEFGLAALKSIEGWDALLGYELIELPADSVNLSIFAADTENLVAGEFLVDAIKIAQNVVKSGQLVRQVDAKDTNPLSSFCASVANKSVYFLG